MDLCQRDFGVKMVRNIVINQQRIEPEDNEVWLCDYSETRGGAEFVKMLCKEHDVKSSDIDKMCNKNNWAIVL